MFSQHLVNSKCYWNWSPVVRGLCQPSNREMMSLPASECIPPVCTTGLFTKMFVSGLEGEGRPTDNWVCISGGEIRGLEIDTIQNDNNTHNRCQPQGALFFTIGFSLSRSLLGSDFSASFSASFSTSLLSEVSSEKQNILFLFSQKTEPAARRITRTMMTMAAMDPPRIPSLFTEGPSATERSLYF